MTDTNLQLKS